MQTATHGKAMGRKKKNPITKRVDTQVYPYVGAYPCVRPVFPICWTAGAAQRGIRSGIITHSAIGFKILNPYGIYAALPGLLGIRSLPKVEMTLVSAQ